MTDVRPLACIALSFASACADPAIEHAEPRALADDCAVEDLGAIVSDDAVLTHPFIVRDLERWGMVHTRCDAAGACVLALTLLSADGSPVGTSVEITEGLGGTSLTEQHPDGFVIGVGRGGELRQVIVGADGHAEDALGASPLSCVSPRPRCTFWGDVGGAMPPEGVAAACACDDGMGATAIQVVSFDGHLSSAENRTLDGVEASLGHLEVGSILAAAVHEGRVLVSRVGSDEPPEVHALSTPDGIADAERVWLARSDARARVVGGQLDETAWVEVASADGTASIALPGERATDLAAVAAAGWIAAAVPLQRASGTRLGLFAQAPDGSAREAELPSDERAAGPHVEPLADPGTFLVLFGDREGERGIIHGVRVDCR